MICNLTVSYSFPVLGAFHGSSKSLPFMMVIEEVPYYRNTVKITLVETTNIYGILKCDYNSGIGINKYDSTL